MTPDSNPDGLAREAERVADRLRVVAPRWAGRGIADEAAQPVRRGLQALADLAADADQRPRRRVPQLPMHALGDQVLVLSHDVVITEDRCAISSAQQILVALRQEL